MKLSFKYYPEFSNDQIVLINELSFHTTKLYNIGNYICVEEDFQAYVELEKALKSNWHHEFLHSHNYQHCLKILEQDWKSYFAASKDYKRNPSKYKGLPKPPKYKSKAQKNQIIFTNLGIRSDKNKVKLSLSKAMQEKYLVKSLNLTLPKKVLKQVKLNALQQIKLAYDESRKLWFMLIIYKEDEQMLAEDFTNTMAIDLGLDNLCAITFFNTMAQFLINGKPLKSKNAYYNKEIARLTGIHMKSTGSKFFKGTKSVRNLYHKRKQYMHNAMHKASRMVINYALDNKCHRIVIGDIKGIKQGSVIKGFVQIPIQKLVELIKYKAKLLGIEVKMQKEDYTSGVSAFDLEAINQKYYDKKRRIQRGLFQSNNGLLVNSDINGSLNIMRKYDKNVVPMLITELRDNGCLNHPVRVLIA